MARSRLAVVLVVAGVLIATVSSTSAADPSTAPSQPADAQPSYTSPSNDGATASGSTKAAANETAAASVSGFPPAIITNGTIQLGVNPEGHLNVDGACQSSGVQTTWVGVRYVPTNADAIAPGCRCEGWGVADSIAGVSGWLRSTTPGSHRRCGS